MAEGNGTEARLTQIEKDNTNLWKKFDVINDDGTNYGKLYKTELDMRCIMIEKDTSNLTKYYGELKKDVAEIKTKVNQGIAILAFIVMAITIVSKFI